MRKKNCWEIKNCGRIPSGDNVKELGECPAVKCFSAYGINEGINGGRACWAIAGTFCEGKQQGAFVSKVRECSNCDFFHRVATEEGENLLPAGEILKRLHKK